MCFASFVQKVWRFSWFDRVRVRTPSRTFDCTIIFCTIMNLTVELIELGTIGVNDYLGHERDQ